MRYSEIIDLAEASLPEPHRDQTYYHGTASRAAAEAILREGIRPGMKTRFRGALIPMAGRVYLTADPMTALFYACGGSFNRLPKNIKEEPDAFLFAFPGSALVDDILPDEDDVGDFIAEHGQKDFATKVPFATFQNGNDTMMVSAYQFWSRSKDAEEIAQQRAIWEFGRKLIPDMTFQKAMVGDQRARASVGKRMLAKMPDWMLGYFMQRAKSFGYTGTIHPTAAWRIDKRQAFAHSAVGNWHDIAEPIGLITPPNPTH